MRKIVCITISLVMTITLAMGINAGKTEAKSLEEKAMAKYEKFMKGKKGYVSIHYVKGSKAPVMFYTKKTKKNFKDPDDENRYAETSKLYIYKKGKVRKVDTKIKTKSGNGSFKALTTGGNSYKLGRLGKKIVVELRNGVRELYIEGTKLSGVEVSDSNYKAIIKKGVMKSIKKLSAKKAKKFIEKRRTSGYWFIFTSVKERF